MTGELDHLERPDDSFRVVWMEAFRSLRIEGSQMCVKRRRAFPVRALQEISSEDRIAANAFDQAVEQAVQIKCRSAQEQHAMAAFVNRLHGFRGQGQKLPH